MPGNLVPHLTTDTPASAAGASAACPECGTRLSGGACPACALGFLLHGSSEGDLEAGDRRVEENVEFGRYTLKQKLASGGMGIVYVAEDRKLKRTVALKMIRGSTFADEDDVARFKLEAEAAAGLDHPNIVPIYEVGRLDGQPFFTMKLIEGQTLSLRLKEHNGTLPPRELAALLSKIARAVHHAHQRGVLHRDLKPGNILVDAEGTPWLTDFGLAKMANTESGLTMTRDHIGTPHYMAPEVAGGNAHAVSTASDVWALGVMLWEMLCGMPPFHGPGPVEIMRRIVAEEPSWPQGTRADGDLVTIARRCMEKNPARRPESAGEVADELDRWLRGEPIKARRVTRHERLIKWVRREPSMAALYAVMLVALIAGFYLWQMAELAVVNLKKTNDRMEKSLRTATATKLAADARLQLSEDPNRALLLAVESVRMTESDGVLPEAASALMSVLSSAGGWDASQGALRGDYQEVLVSFNDYHRRAALISPDGHWLLSLNTQYWGEKPTPAAIYDLLSEESRPLRRWNIWDESPSIVPATACWLPDSRRLLTVDGVGRLRIQTVVASGMAEGLEDSAGPVLAELGTVPLRKGAQLLSAWPRTEGDSMHVTWSELSGESPWSIRIARTRITPAGPEGTVELTAGGDWTPHVTFRPSPCGRCGVVSSATGDATPFLVDLSSETVVRYPLVVPFDRVMFAAIDEARRQVVLQLSDDTVYSAAIPAPGTPAQSIRLRRVLGYPATVRRIALSPDGRWLAVAGDSPEVLVAPLDVDNPQPVAQYFSAGDGTAVNFSPDSQWLAAGGKGRAVHLWRMDSIRSGTPPVLLRGLPSFVGEVVFSRDNAAVAAVAFGGVVRRWTFDGVSGAAMPRHLPAAAKVVQSAVSRDGAWAAAACDTADDGWAPNLPLATGDGALTLSRLTKRSRLVLDSFGAGATSVAFSPDGRWIAGAGRDATVKLWDFAEAALCSDRGAAAPAPRHVFPVEEIRTAFRWRLAFHPDGRLFMVNGDGVLYCWDTTAPDPRVTVQSEVIHSIRYLLPDITVSPDGRLLAVARHGWDTPVPGNDQFGSQVLLFDVSGAARWPLRRAALLQSDFLEYTNLAFSPDNRWLASGGTGYAASLWDLHAPDIGGSRRRPPVKAHLMAGVSFSPDSQRLALGSSDGRLYFWNWQNPADLRAIQTESGITCTTWLPDGHLLTSGTSDCLSLWDTDLTRLKSLARRIAGRELSSEERDRFHVP